MLSFAHDIRSLFRDSDVEAMRYAFISPFVGRLDDISEEGLQVVREIVEIYRLHHLPTLVLAASMRSPRHITDVAKAGADIATVPFKVLEAAAKHPLTDKGIESFLQDWKSFQSHETAQHGVK
jgi:transaldolase